MSASNDPAEAQGERMISLENELEGFLEATQDPAAWLMVFAAKDEIERLTLMNAAYKTVIDGATLDARQKQAEIERLNARLKVVRDQYNGDTNICHELMKEALGDED